MKKIVGILSAAAVLATSVFAVDLAANVHMTADVLSGDKDHVEFFELNKKEQKDNDALVLSANLDNAGAQFQFWYEYDGSGDMALKVRSTSLWFKPIDMLKVTVGDIDVGIYKEMLHFCKDPNGHKVDLYKPSEWGGWAYYYNSYSGTAVAAGSGFLCELTPIDGLWIGLALAAGAGTHSYPDWNSSDTASIILTWADGTADENKFKYREWGVGAKYDLNGLAGIPLSVGVSWRDTGKGNFKLLGIGADYGNRWAEGLYAMVNGRLRFNDVRNGEQKGSGTLDGVTIDNYFRYGVGAFEAQLRAPVTIRLTGDDDDPSWLVWSAEVSYRLDGFTPYLLFGNDLNSVGAYDLSDKFGDTFGMQIQPGARFSVGACAIDAGVKLEIVSKKDNGNDNLGFKYSVPVTLDITF